MRLLPTILLLLLPLLCVSWWDVGHMLTAAIAEAKLLDEDPYAAVHFRQLIYSINSLCDGRSNTFIQSACWPDDIKSNKYGMGLFNPWHYKDGPYVEDTVNPVINYTESAVNSLEIMKIASKVLKTNINKNTAQRALFARYVVHLAGDMHQPLHSVALFNETYPKGDVGGNLEKVILKNGTSSNFHSYWDAGAYVLQNDSWVMVRPLNMQNLTALKNVATEMVSQYGKEVAGLGEIIDPYVWAQQSFLVAQNTTYPYIATTNRLNDEYIKLTYETSKKRITLAGFRLANYIKDIYKQKGHAKTFKQDDLKPNDVWKMLAEDSRKAHSNFCKDNQKQEKRFYMRKEQVMI